MKKEIKVPAMGESITEATVGELFKEDGAAVKMDEEILELETDKVNQVLYAPQDGVISYSVQVDDVVEIGQVVGFVDGNGTATTTSAGQSEKPAEKAAASEESSEAPKAPSPSPAGGSARLSREAFIAGLSQAEAHKPVQSEPKAPPAPQPEPPKASLTPVEVTGNAAKPESRRRMPRIRRVIADRLVEAQQTTAMLTTFNECDMSAVMELRSQYKDSFIKKHGVKLGFMSFFVKACVAALKAVPQVNCYIDGGDLVRREYYDIGIAVGTERGLVVPVLQGCDQLSLAGVESTIGAFAKKAREGTLSVEDLQGGGFTITNGGIYGSLLSTPILNPPQCGILGMHKIQKRPVVVGDEVKVRPMMYLALSYDHRIVDGAEAVTFLVHIKDCIEDPSRLLLEL